jgi:GH25 family lysozyme M1 (1,4-beta-N-acetylmuramidase)
MALKGIDVSEWQGTIDWREVAKDGVQFAVIHAGYGRELSQKDKYFERNYAGARAAGIKVGAFWYSYADSVARAEQEARTCLKVLDGKHLDLPVFFDQEYEPGILKLSTKTRTDIVLKFLETIKAAGRPCGLYSSTDFITTKLQANRLTAYPLWIAEYGSKLHYTGKVWAWQYTDKGRVAGIKGRVDMDHGYFAQTHTASPDLLRKGDRGDDVKLLQHRLNLLGWQLTEDGIWGVQTDSAVRGYQYRAGLTVDGIVGAKTRAALIRDAILARAAEIGAYMVKHKWHYKDATYKAKDTWTATKALSKPGSSCSHFVSWVLQDVGLLTEGKRISHDGGKVTGTGNLLGCQVIQAKGKTWDKLDDLRPGDVCVWDSNLAIYAGGGKWYDAGGPFQANTKDGRYTNIGPISPHYDRTKPIYYIVRAKV